MFIPTPHRPSLIEGYMLTRRCGIPLARYMRGSVVVRQRYGVTMYHALKRVSR
jgi:hypothetical protein